MPSALKSLLASHSWTKDVLETSNQYSQCNAEEYTYKAKVSQQGNSFLEKKMGLANTPGWTYLLSFIPEVSSDCLIPLVVAQFLNLTQLANLCKGEEKG